MTAAQQAQQHNRTSDGKYTTKHHSEAPMDVGLNIEADHAQQQRNALAHHLEVERQALEAKQRVLELLAVHDLYDDLRAKGVQKVEIAEAFEDDYDAPGSFYVASEPEFLGGYEPTPAQADDVTTYLMDQDISFNALAGADTDYAHGDGTVTIDTTKDPGGISRRDLEDQVEKLLNTDYEHRIPGGLDPAKVTANSNTKLLNIDMITSNRHLDPNHRMELILAQAEDWDRATRKSTSRPNKYGNVPPHVNFLGRPKDR